jgi:hypothetical protein
MRVRKHISSLFSVERKVLASEQCTSHQLPVKFPTSVYGRTKGIHKSDSRDRPKDAEKPFFRTNTYPSSTGHSNGLFSLPLRA